MTNVGANLGTETEREAPAAEPVQVVRTLIGTRDDIDALVLGAAPSGNPGPLCSNLTGTDAGKLPCPVMIIPGSLSDERLEQLS